jgi:serine/threonine protein kinase/Tol biopolymer transport system component
MSDQIERLTMALAARYRIERELGAGGMATVYLAEDLKHNRKVAVKVLKPELAVAIGAERFLAEIKTTANLQHPHILALHDSGEVNGTVFYVMPYVEGESLRDRLDREKQLPIDDSLRIAGEVADALEYAHEHGVIHRDIKPENILLQRGHAVVADFGIALAASKTGGARMTETGMSLGTPMYMSPEQAMGAREVDARTDIYSLGCVLYEMLAGEPPFVGPTAQAIVAKVITESPRSLREQRRTVPPHVDATVQISLEKLAADRFASAAAFGESLRDGDFSLRGSGRSITLSSRPRTFADNAAKWVGGAVVALALTGGGYVAGRRSTAKSANDGMLMQQRTYDAQKIFSARYTTGGDIVYSAADTGDVPRIYTVTSAYPQPRPVSDPRTNLLSISSKDEMAVLVGAVLNHHRVFTGTLAQMPVVGGTPRELLTNVHDADWAPDGAQLAVAHDVNSKDDLEYPIGTVIYSTPGYLSDIRFSPDGQRIAFNEHPEKGDDRGAVAVVDLKGNHKVLTPQYPAIQGIAWVPGENSIAYSASIDGGLNQVNEVTLDGRVVAGSPGVGDATIQDIAADGRRLIIRSDTFTRVWGKQAADATAKDLSWLNISFFPILSGDGSLLVFGDGSRTAGENYAVMLRRTDGSPAIRLGEGADLGLSRDKQWVVSEVPSVPVKLMLYPTGAGSARRLDHGEFGGIIAASFLGDGSQLLVCGNEPKHAVRCYVRPIGDGAMRAFTPEGIRTAVASPDGQSIVALTGDNGYRQFSIRDGTSQSVPGLTPSDRVLRYSPDGKFLWTKRTNTEPVRVEQVDLKTGARSVLLPDFGTRRAGVLNVMEVALADDPRNYAYMERESVSYLFELKRTR